MGESDKKDKKKDHHKKDKEEDDKRKSKKDKGEDKGKHSKDDKKKEKRDSSNSKGDKKKERGKKEQPIEEDISESESESDSDSTEGDNSVENSIKDQLITENIELVKEIEKLADDIEQVKEDIIIQKREQGKRKAIFMEIKMRIEKEKHQKQNLRNYIDTITPEIDKKRITYHNLQTVLKKETQMKNIWYTVSTRVASQVKDRCKDQKLIKEVLAMAETIQKRHDENKGKTLPDLPAELIQLSTSSSQPSDNNNKDDTKKTTRSSSKSSVTENSSSSYDNEDESDLDSRGFDDEDDSISFPGNNTDRYVSSESSYFHIFEADEDGSINTHSNPLFYEEMLHNDSTFRNLRKLAGIRADSLSSDCSEDGNNNRGREILRDREPIRKHHLPSTIGYSYSPKNGGNYLDTFEDHSNSCSYTNDDLYNDNDDDDDILGALLLDDPFGRNSNSRNSVTSDAS